MIKSNSIKINAKRVYLGILNFAFLGSGVAYAQQSQYQQPSAQTPGVAAPQANSPVNNLPPAVPVATNPFGSVKTQEAPQQTINYGSPQNNINNGQQVILPANIDKMAPQDTIPNPAVSQQQMMGYPSAPPTGLPQDMSTQNYSGGRSGRSSTNIDPTEATMNILNTPNSRIRELNRDLYDKGRVINEGPVTAPRAANGVVIAHISPGSTSPVIRLFKNRTSTLIVTDMTGQPWPIVNYDGLSTDDFTVKRLDAPSPEGYVLSVTPKGAFVSGNLVLILKGLPTPLNVEFVSAQKDVDTTTEIRVQAKGPNAKFSSITLPQAIDSALLSVLQGVAPQSAKELKVSTPAVQAWLAKDGSMYVRTRYKIMSPAFENVTSSPDGTYAYKMVPVPVVLFKVADGRFGEFTVDGF